MRLKLSALTLRNANFISPLDILEGSLQILSVYWKYLGEGIDSRWAIKCWLMSNAKAEN